MVSHGEQFDFYDGGGRLTLTEIAPGVDLERGVRARTARGVQAAEDLRAMDARIFRAQPMRLRP